MQEPIPLVDLAWQHAQIADVLLPELHAAMAEGAFIGGEAVTRFEHEFAALCGVGHCVGVANGTDAVELALRAAGVAAGDAVVVPANTFIATAEAVVRLGARVVLIDCDDHGLLDVDQLEDVNMRSQARAVVPVHLYGRLVDVEAVAEIADRHKAIVVEDAAQCHGARIGAYSAAAATSFYPGKNLGAYGDAGAVVTRSATLARRVRLLANHGSERRYEHKLMGMNSRLDALQANVLSAKLAHLGDWNEFRRAAACRYDELLRNLDVQRPAISDRVWHQYVIGVDCRDHVLERLHADGIGAAVHYPTPIHLLPAGRSLGYAPGSFPVAEGRARRILSLPLFPGITADQQDRVVVTLVRALVTRPARLARSAR